MSRFYSHLNTAQTIITQYKGDLPLAIYLKNFFSKDKKYGSRDRRTIAGLCYAYYRVCTALPSWEVADKILAGLFLTSQSSNPILSELKPQWNVVVQQALSEKLAVLGVQPTRLFPLVTELSSEIDPTQFNLSFLHQPKLFIRLRPNSLQSSAKKLAASGLFFEKITETGFAFDSGTKIETVLEVNKDYVVQDYNSQRTIGLLEGIFPANVSLNVWDCCAASGGKSIMAVDVLRHVQLTVSDVRDTILANLEKRFKAAGIKNYHSFEADLTQSAAITSRFDRKPFDLIICDAPCTGSGTWSRTPEQLAFFNQKQIEQYSQLQKKIAGNVVPAIKKGGYLLYITCSVFKKENEEVVEYLTENYPVKLIEMEVLKGYEMQADSMFAALLQVQS